MLNCEEILATVIRPTGDCTTESRTYKLFFDPDRTRTANYPDTRFEAIWQISSQVNNSFKEAVIVEATNSLPILETKNIDPIAYEFCRVNRLLASLDIIYNQIIFDFENLFNLQVEYFVDPDGSKQEGVFFRIVIKGKPKKILKQENNFYLHIRKSIPIYERKYFSIVYSVI
jgi:hypothetical protein